ncbi:transglutaminase-like domain-containing protein [Spirosoma soli]|uniref:Transglutaminase-like domain-containing protein n=1 Tax=Spirosoma soli TaxID=1770529 RepID=A0ABW5M1C7_9BACT
MQRIIRKNAWRNLILAILAGAFVASVPDRPRERTVEFTYKALVNDIPTGAKKVDLWIPVPHDSPFQRITNLVINSPYPYQIDTLAYGNRLVHIRIASPQKTSFTVDMRFTALRKEHIQERLQGNNPPETASSQPDMNRWLQPDRLVPIDGNVKRWAQDVIDKANAKTDLEKARAIYNHIIATVKYDKTGTGWGRGDIYYACDVRRGNCSDFHAIFIGYCRAVGIPARFAIGFSLPTERPAGQISGYHCWAEFYLNGVGWVPIDASEAAKNPAKREYFFGAHDENRIEFTIGRDLTLYPQQQEPLNYFIYPYVEADGKPLTTVDKAFTYQNLAGSTVSSKK